MKVSFLTIIVSLILAVASCTSNHKDPNDADKKFAAFEDRFLDAYWKQYPSNGIYNGYGKYYDKLTIPDSTGVLGNISFSKQWQDSLLHMDTLQLSDNNKISWSIIQNQLESDIWYQSVFREYEWNPSLYNISGECDYIINQPYAPLDERLITLSNRLQYAGAYYKAAFKILHRPTKEHTELAIIQNQGGLSVFGQALTDSIKASHLSDADKATLQQRITGTTSAINVYIDSLKAFVANTNFTFRSFRIGKELFTQKFRYDLATNLTPGEVYAKAMADKKMYHQKMFVVATALWPKYYGAQPKPTDTIQLVQSIIDKIQLRHAAPKDFYDSLTNQVHQLKKFILSRNLFDFDTINPPVKVRIMPEYARGVTVANAEFAPTYQAQGETYYNIDDLTLYPKEKAESALKEYNNYASQFLSIHEAMPGHCLQGIYNKKKSPDVLRSVFQNGAMVEGWAVYTENMMFENGWGNNSPEIELVFYKLKLRVLANVLLDYDLQCLDAPKEAIIALLTKGCFQTAAQAEEKYHRATVSQAQLCFYYTGGTAILSLRDEYKKKMGDQFTLKDFHEKFLSFGSSPIKYIREKMLQ